MDNENSSTVSYLVENSIQNRQCDTTKPFAYFIYAHDPYDSVIAKNTFEMLSCIGYNVWLDVANVPQDRYSWQRAVFSALDSPNCNLVVFFQSENALKTELVADQLQHAANNAASDIVVVDIKTNPGESIKKFLNSLELDTLNSPDNDTVNRRFDSCQRIMGIVNSDMETISLSKDCENDVGIVVNRLSVLFRRYRIYFDKDKRNDDYKRDEVLEECAQEANDEIEKNSEYYFNTDFGVMAGRLRTILPSIQVIEDVYRDVARIKNYNKRLRRSLIPRKKTMFKIFIISFVVLAIIGVFASTLSATPFGNFVHNYVKSYKLLLNAFPSAQDAHVQNFVDVVLVSLVDAAIVLGLVVLVSVEYHGIQMMINNARISNLNTKGEDLILEYIPRIPNYPQNLMCSFAMEFIIGCEVTRKASSISEAIKLFNEYKDTDEGVRGVSQIAPWLHDMREAFDRNWSRLPEIDGVDEEDDDFDDELDEDFRYDDAEVI